MKTFRVVQFNMQFGQGWDDAAPDAAPIRIEQTIAELQRHQADVILLQEVEHALPDGKQLQPPPNYTRLCAALADYDSWFAYPAADARELPFGIGLAIFSRTPLRERTRVDLPSPPIEFDFDGRRSTPTDRLLIGAKTTLLDREIQLFNTHLLAFFMLGASSMDYPEQLQRVVAAAAAAPVPTLLGGDFNVRRHQALIAQFGLIGFSSVQQEQSTWRRRPYVLDHLFYHPALRPVRHAVVPTLASDHHVLVADFCFR